jgi:hypothetical protein
MADTVEIVGVYKVGDTPMQDPDWGSIGDCPDGS